MTHGGGAASLPPTSVAAFFTAFGYRWLAVMSGAPSVPLAIIALYGQGTWQKILFGVLAIICAVSASYLVWKRERTRANDPEQRLLDVTDKRRLGQRLSE